MSAYQHDPDDAAIRENPQSRQFHRLVRKEQITIRLDPGMIADARQVAARKGIGYHTLLRMWVMEGITRAYQEGQLDGPPRSWTDRSRHTQDRSGGDDGG
jgi:predicted DNA binding CopG/RHH family protein